MRKFLYYCISLILLSSCTKKLEKDIPVLPLPEILVVDDRLSDVITEDNMKLIKKLTINGIIQGTDWGILFEMAKRGSLYEIDMYNATIVDDPKYDFWNADEIPMDAFYDCPNLKHVRCPHGLKRIRWGAFNDCTSLSSIIIPDGVVCLEERVFQDCISLTSMTIPSSVDSIGESCFLRCFFHTTSFVNNSACKSEDNWGAIIYDKEEDDGLIIVDDVVIGCRPWSTSVSIPFGVTEIGEQAFRLCRSLTSVSIPNSVKYIGSYAFYCCSSLTALTIPNSVTNIGASACFGCRKLKSVTLSQMIDTIGEDAFSDTPIEGTLELPPSLKVIERRAFADTNIEAVVINSDIELPYYENVYVIGGNSVFANCKKIKKVTLAEGCTKLEVGFDHCVSLSEVNLPNTIETLGRNSGKTGNYIFAYCSSLRNIKIPEKVWFIGYYAFNHSGLTSIALPDDVQYLWTYAFNSCTDLNEVKMPKQLRQIEQGCFKGCENIIKIEIPDYVKSIGPLAFANCSKLSDITWGNSIQSIASEAFINCSQLSEVDLPLAFTELGESAFLGCSKLSTIRSLGQIKKIGQMTFKDCISLGKVNVPNTIKEFGSSCFLHCPQLKQIDIPESVTSIGEYAFGYTGLESIAVHWNTPLVIPNNVFTGVATRNVHLSVPQGASSMYRASSPWNQMRYIEEL